jgi:NitT/TauT family transport system ATP-binding protein
MFRLAEIEGGDIKLTDIGRQFAELGMDDRKRLFQRELLANVPLAAHVRRVLAERANHVAPKSRFLDELEDHMSSEDAEHTLRAVTAWGRFAEAFAYDDDSETFSLENPT